MANNITNIYFSNTFGDLVRTANNLVNAWQYLGFYDWDKPSGTFSISSSGTGFLSNTISVFSRETRVEGVGSSLYVQNNAEVGKTLSLTDRANNVTLYSNGTSIFSGGYQNYASYLTGIGYENVNNSYGIVTLAKSLFANSVDILETANVNLIQANNQIIYYNLSGNTAQFSANVTVGNLVSNNFIYAANNISTNRNLFVSVNSHVIGLSYTDRLQANTSANTRYLSVTDDAFVDYLQANTNLQTGVAVANTRVVTGIVQANNTVIANTVTANSIVTSPTLHGSSNVFSGYVQANTRIVTGIVQANNTVIANTVSANSLVTTPTLHGSSNVFTDYVQANTRVVTGIVQANTNIFTATISANSSIVTPTVQASSNVYTGFLKANNLIVTDVIESQSRVITDTALANTRIITATLQSNNSILSNDILANTRVVTGIVQANTHIYTDYAQANTRVVTGIVQANTNVITNDVLANTRVVAGFVQANNTVISNTISANTVVTSPTLHGSSNVFSGYVQANTRVVTGIVQANNIVHSNTVSANTVVTSPTLHGSSNVFSGYIQANTRVVTETVQSNTNVITNDVLANTRVVTGIVQANTNVITNDVLANTRVVTGIVQANTRVVTETVQSNTNVITNTVSANSLVTSPTLHGSSNVFTAILQANSAANTQNLSVTQRIFTNDFISNTNILVVNNANTTNLYASNLVQANSVGYLDNSQNPSVYNVYSREALFNNASIVSNMVVGGDLKVLGATQYDGKSIRLSANSPSWWTNTIPAELIVNRKLDEANGIWYSANSDAAISWSDLSLRWRAVDVPNSTANSKIYTNLLLELDIADNLNETSSVRVPSSRVHSLTRTHANSAFLNSNSAYTHANSVYTHANSAITIGTTPVYLNRTNTVFGGISTLSVTGTTLSNFVVANTNVISPIVVSNSLQANNFANTQNLSVTQTIFTRDFRANNDAFIAEEANVNNKLVVSGLTGQIDLKPLSTNVRIWDNNNSNYHEIVTGDTTANYLLNLAAGNTTLVPGTMVPTSLTITASGGIATDATTNLSVNRQFQLTGQARSLHDLATTGLFTRNSAGSIISRSIAVSGTGISITNADGSAGNPTITSNATSANTVSTIVARDASGNFSAGTITASLSGNATSSSKVNSILTRGTYLTGSNFDGSAATTWTVDATTTNTANKIVARDGSGNFSAGTITAALSGNASTATTLQTARNINGVSFNGSANILVPNLFGTNGTTTLNTVGVTSGVNYATITNAANGSPVLISTEGQFDSNVGLTISTKGTGAITLDTGVGLGAIDLKPGTSTVRIWDTNNTNYWEFITSDVTSNYSVTLPVGNVVLTAGTMVPTSRTLTIANGTGITGGGSATDLSTNRSWTIGLTGQALNLHDMTTTGLFTRTSSGTITARSIAVSGTGISITNADGSAGNPTIASNATSANTVSTIVARDGSGNFSAGTITSSYFNSSDNSVTTGVTGIISKTSDNFYRTASAAAVASFISGQTMNINGTATGIGGAGTVSVSTGSFSSTLSVTGQFSSSTRILATGSQASSSLGTSTGSLGGIEIQGPNSSSAAFIAFHRPGAYATYFGLGTNNRLQVGGWSAATSSWNIPYSTLGIAFDNTDQAGTPARVWGGTNDATTWYEYTPATLTVGSYLTGSNYTGYNATTWAVDATTTNTANKIVVRDGSGNFSAGTITASLSGNASTASKVNNILTRGTYLTGSNFDGSAATTWAVDATTTNTANKIVARDGNGQITATTAIIGTSEFSSVGTIELGRQGTGDRGALIDFHSAGTPGQYDYHARIIKDVGANGNFWMSNIGSGNTGMSAGTGTAILSPSGDFTASGNVTAYSDKTLKKDVITLENSLDKVLNLRGVSFTKIDSNKKGIGVIAQEVQEVLPEVVVENSDGILSVAYGNIVGVLIEAIKEQQKQIDELKSKIGN